MDFNFTAPCSFGVEGLLSDELKRLGAKDVMAENGRVKFRGDADLAAKVNICSRLAERILIVLGEFRATDFDGLFDGVKNLPFEEFIAREDAFPVTGYSINSALHSLPDCQSIIKKAVVERLKISYRTDWFRESGAVCKIRFSIIKDNVSIMLDTSGEGLHKRGYRAVSNKAPIKETLAAAICNLARIFPDTQLIDPFCGSGTILIEAAMMAKNIAPGLNRRFAGEQLSFIGKAAFARAREEALMMVEKKVDFKASGFDIDKDAVELTLKNAKKAGVSSLISASVGDIKELSLPEGWMKVITNPPYGERLLDLKAAENIYKIMGDRMPKQRGKGYFIISPHDEFEAYFGRPADKKRKLYNGMIKCDLYMYFK